MTIKILLVNASDFSSYQNKKTDNVVLCVRGVVCNEQQPDLVGVSVDELNVALSIIPSINKIRFNNFLELVRDDLYDWYIKNEQTDDENVSARIFRELIKINQAEVRYPKLKVFMKNKLKLPLERHKN